MAAEATLAAAAAALVEVEGISVTGWVRIPLVTPVELVVLRLGGAEERLSLGRSVS